MNFWRTLSKPIIGLAPMDGVTDAPFRYITDKYGKPSVLYTEFVSVDAITHGGRSVLASFETHQTETPTVAQIYGTDLAGYRIATIVVCELQFAGIDINMGCPAKSVASRGAGAGLILNPAHAQAIITTVSHTLKQWATHQCGLADLPSQLQEQVRFLQKNKTPNRRLLPLSIKTRIGYDKPVTESWISSIVGSNISALTIHGRTLRQGYGGLADWTEIGKASLLAHTLNPHIVVLGNGDVHSVAQARQQAAHYGLDGVLIGRAAMGNPWVFTDSRPSPITRMQVALEHATIMATQYPDRHFITMRKHLPTYVGDFEGAAQLRGKLSRVNSLSELQELLAPYLLQKQTME